MQTHFTDKQRTLPAIQIADEVLRKCVHCGFCTATCPTYRITGDERESPRGRISLIQHLLESEEAPTPATVANLDHCLSCLSCESTCPSGVSYRRLIDQGRELIEKKYRRPLFDRSLRALLAWLLPRRTWFRFSLIAGRWTKPGLKLVGKYSASVAALLDLIPSGKTGGEAAIITPGIYAAEDSELKRVALITGCVQSVLAPEIDAAAVRLLTRHGCTVIVPEPSGAGCCGALPHHMGKSEQAQKMAKLNLSAWQEMLNNKERPLDAIIMTASGCGSMLKDYPHLLNNDQANDGTDEGILSLLIKDISVVIKELFELKKPELSDSISTDKIIAWQNPCSLQHGLKEITAPISILQSCGFTVREPRDAHLCCGSAGTYNLLQPEFAKQLGEEKTARLADTGAELVVSGNIGCITQLNKHAANNANNANKTNNSTRPVVHLAQIVDWATGGPAPPVIQSVQKSPSV